MGVVYQALDEHLDRLVAIKVLSADSAGNSERRKRFAQEARAASALNHPNIVHVYDIDEHDGVLFIAMEYVAGKALDQLIPGKGMRLSEALRLSAQIAGALAAAHEAGIVHRDLKPGNVMLGDDGRIRVLDFGLAKLTEAEARGSGELRETVSFATATPKTEDGSILGTVGYVSPEQAEGKTVDARSDIFSFGCLLYEMLTGRQAFRGDSRISTLAAVIRDNPKPISEYAAEVPAEIERIVNRCLRKDPERRFQEMKDLQIALEDLREEWDSGKLPAQSARPGQWRHFGPAWLMGGVGVAAIAVVLGWLWMGRTSPATVEGNLEAVPLTSYPGNEITPSLSPDGNQVAFSWNGEGEDNYDIYVQVTGSGEPLRLTSDAAFDWAPAWSPDGREIRFYRYRKEGSLAVMSVPPLPGREKNLGESPFPAGLPEVFLKMLGPAWSPDGTVTVHPGETGLLLRPPDGDMRVVGDVPGGGELFPAFAPEGRRLAYVWQTGGANSDLYVTSLTADMRADGEPRRLVAGMRFINHPVWTPDGKEILFSAYSGAGMSLWRVSSSGATEPRRLALASVNAASPTLSADGSRLVFEQRTENSSIWMAGLHGDGGEPRRVITSTRGDWSPSFSPDGSQIAFASDRSGAIEIWLADADGSSPVQLSSLGQFSLLPEWSPDGGEIVFQNSGSAGNDLYAISVRGGGLRRLTSHPDDDMQATWSPDGKWIYFVSNRSGQHQIWRMHAGGGEATQVTQDGGEFARASEDGRTVYFTRGEYGSMGLWKKDLQSGEESRLDSPPIYDWGFSLAKGQAYFTLPLAEGSYPVMALDLESGKLEAAGRIGYSPFAKFAVSLDGKRSIYSLQEKVNSDLMLVEKFH